MRETNKEDLKQAYKSEKATVHCVAGGSRAALGARLVKKTDNDGDIVSKLLEKCSELGIRSSRVLLDRGFFSVDVIQTLNHYEKAS